jgi:hypothetical protein
VTGLRDHVVGRDQRGTTARRSHHQSDQTSTLDLRDSIGQRIRKCAYLLLQWFGLSSESKRRGRQPGNGLDKLALPGQKRTMRLLIR